MTRSSHAPRSPRAALARTLAALSLGGSLATLGCSQSADPAAAAATTGDAGDADVLPALAAKALETPPGGLAFYTPIIRDIQPGDDVTYCTVTDHITEEELFINTTDGVQSHMGHHAIMLYTTTPMEPGTGPCTSDGMEKLSQLIGGSGGEGNGTYVPPPNVGMLIPKGSQFVVQTHWINAGDQPLDVQAMMVTVPGPDGPDRVVAGTMAVVDVGFNVPAMEKGKSGVECVFEQDHQLLMTIGHEHEWGSHVRARVTRKDGTVDTLFDRSFSPSDIFDPPIDHYTLGEPLTFRAGEKISMDCEWDNTTSEPLTFPREMCVFFGYTLRAGDARCINGSWLGAAAGDAGVTTP